MGSTGVGYLVVIGSTGVGYLVVIGSTGVGYLVVIGSTGVGYLVVIGPPGVGYLVVIGPPMLVDLVGVGVGLVEDLVGVGKCGGHHHQNGGVFVGFGLGAMMTVLVGTPRTCGSRLSRGTVRTGTVLVVSGPVAYVYCVVGADVVFVVEADFVVGFVVGFVW